MGMKLFLEYGKYQATMVLHGLVRLPILPTETTFVYTFPSAGEWFVRLTCTSLNLCDSTIEHQISSV